MSTNQITTPIKDLFNRKDVQDKFKELLGKRSSAFMTTVAQIVATNDLFKNVDSGSVYQVAIISATLDLPLNNNLGLAYIVPYKGQASFQLGYRGYIQLALRSGQFQAISETPVYKGQIISNNPLTGYEFDFTKKESDEIIGYASYFRLNNGFEKTLYLTIDEIRLHALKYSQTYKKGYGLWKDNFDAMARKTIIKMLLSKYAPLSIEMQTALITDQSVIKNADTLEVTYVDNEQEKVDKEAERVKLMLQDCQTLEDVNLLQETIGSEYPVEMFDQRKEEIKIQNAKNILGE